jgi:hypothetical protein
MALGRYEEAKKFMEEYSADERGKVFAKSISNISVFAKNADAYSIDSVDFNSTENDFSPAYFAQGKIVFTSSRKKTMWINRKHGWTGNNYYNIYATEKGSNGAYLKPKKFMRDMDSKFNNGPICFSQDKTVIILTRNSAPGSAGSDGNYKLELFEAKLNIDGFEKVTPMPFNSKEHNCAHPSLSNDGNTLYFASDMPGGQGGLDIWYSKRDGTGAWGPAVNMGDKVNTKGNEMFPYIATNNQLYFASNGQEGLGGLDIYEAKMKSDGSVGKIYNMGTPINTSNDDFGIVFADDMKSGYLSSNRKNRNMDDDIYAFNVLRCYS